MNKSLELVKALVERGRDMEKALVDAVAAGNVDVLRYLPEACVDLEEVDAVLAKAEKEERTDMVALLNTRSSM